MDHNRVSLHATPVSKACKSVKCIQSAGNARGVLPNPFVKNEVLPMSRYKCSGHKLEFSKPGTPNHQTTNPWTPAKPRRKTQNTCWQPQTSLRRPQTLNTGINHPAANDGLNSAAANSSQRPQPTAANPKTKVPNPVTLTPNPKKET